MKPFASEQLQQATPKSLKAIDLPRRAQYYASPVDWRNEVIYFLLVDRFSDGQESTRPLLNRSNLKAARTPNWRFDDWAASGAHHWQGGNLKGVVSKLDYLQTLGVTTIWMSPVYKQRAHQNDYHGYGIQDFLEVDPHLGDREDLINLIDAAHQRGMRVIMDIIFNHSGSNWLYPSDEWMVPYKPYPQRYEFGRWLNGLGQPINTIQHEDDGVFPVEFQNPDYYTRAGSGSLGAGDIHDPLAEHKRSDFFTLRDFDLDKPDTLRFLINCYKYWIALTDCDGFRIDTLKHVSKEHARNFCGAIKEFASNIGKENFFLVGEIAGGDYFQDIYLDAVSRNLNAALDIGEMRPRLINVAKGLTHPSAYFDSFHTSGDSMGSHRNLGNKHVSILDDHDHVFGEKLRFTSNAVSDHQIVAAVAIQFFTLGIPCIYYGTEQALSGPEIQNRGFLPGWGGGDHADRYLREALFGPEHPRKSGNESMEIDTSLPGFGPFGTAGHHCFDNNHPAYKRISDLGAVRQAFPVLRRGRQYIRPTSIFNLPFELRGNGELLAWSRILDDEEALCVVNVHGLEYRGARIIVDGILNKEGSHMEVILNSMHHKEGIDIENPKGTLLPIQKDDKGNTFVEVYNLGPSEVMVLHNHAN